MMPELTFGERVKIILAFKKMSQRELAKRANLNESQLSKLLKGKRKPLYHELTSIVDVLDIPYDCLVGKSPLFDEMLETIEEVVASCIW